MSLQNGLLNQDGLLTMSSVQEWILGLEVRDGLALLLHYLEYNCPQLSKINKKLGSSRTPLLFYLGGGILKFGILQKSNNLTLK